MVAPKDPAGEGRVEERRAKGVPSMAACAGETVCTDGEIGVQAGSAPVMEGWGGSAARLVVACQELPRPPGRFGADAGT